MGMNMTPTYPSDLTDAQWALIQPLLPKPHKRGRRRRLDYRRVLDAIFYLQRTGCQWRQLPHDFPPWGTGKKSVSVLFSLPLLGQKGQKNGVMQVYIWEKRAVDNCDLRGSL
jgi:transposase